MKNLLACEVGAMHGRRGDERGRSRSQGGRIISMESKPWVVALLHGLPANKLN